MGARDTGVHIFITFVAQNPNYRPIRQRMLTSFPILSARLWRSIRHVVRREAIASLALGTCLLFVFTTSIADLYAQRSASSAPAQRVEVVVVDSLTGKPIADVYIQTEREASLTSSSGVARLGYRHTLRLVLSHLSYRTKEITLTPKPGSSPLRIALSPAVASLDEVSIYGAKISRSISVAQQISQEEILSNMGKTLASALASTKGVAMLSTGPLASKPTIHGMHSGRVMIVNNGMRHIGQDWGVDHAPEVDYDMAGEIRVVKGAEAVRFGSGALGGVVEMQAPKLVYAGRKLSTELSTGYASNSRQVQAMLRLSGSLGQHWSWRVQTSGLSSGDRHTAEYYLQNTGERKWSAGLQLGYRGHRLQSELSYGLYYTRQGTMFQWQIGSEALFKQRLSLGRPVLEAGEQDRFTRRIELPHSTVRHHQLALTNSYRIDDNQRISLNVGLQQDLREEYHHRRNNLSHIPEYSMTLLSADADASYRHSALLGLQTEVGLVGHWGQNTNREGTGVVPLIPNYAELLLGGYAWQRARLGRLALEWGGRYEFRFVNADGHDYSGAHYGGAEVYNLWGAQLGASYALAPEIKLVSSLGLTQRAPHVFEMHSNGIDKASGVYASGNPHLTPETGYKWVAAIEGRTGHLDWSVEGFLQYVRDYIYYSFGGSYRRMVSGYYPLFLFRQEDAQFRGIDAKLEWQILGSPLTYGIQGGYIWARTQSGLYPPGLSPLRIRQWLAYEHTLGRHTKLSASVSNSWVGKQRLFSPSTDLVDHTPDSYHLWGANLKLAHQTGARSRIELEIEGTNLTNRLYKEYTNRFRYYFHDLGRDVRIRLSYFW